MNATSRIRRILCGVGAAADEGGGLEIGASDRHTALQAMRLAARENAEVRIVHVVDWFDERTARGARDIELTVGRELDDDLRAIETEARQLGVAIDYEQRRGRRADELVQAAAEWDADVIAISARRSASRSLGRALHGSTTTRVLRSAKCPVWVVAPGSGEVKRVLALIDRSEVSPRVVEAASVLGRIYGADLHALCCLDYPDDIALHRLPSAHAEIQRYHLEVRARAWADLEQLTADGDSWHLTLGEDWVVREAPRLIAEKRIDLTVMAANSKPRLAGALLGTTAERLLGHIDASVWVVRS